jgi:ribA/ribD-fused uncharacterized protein
VAHYVDTEIPRLKCLQLNVEEATSLAERLVRMIGTRHGPCPEVTVNKHGQLDHRVVIAIQFLDADAAHKEPMDDEPTQPQCTNTEAFLSGLNTGCDGTGCPVHGKSESVKAVIDRFTNEFSFLSNFWACKVTFEGTQYRSAEHAYQAAKTTDWVERETVRKAGTAWKAKELGKGITLRRDWSRVRVAVMESILEDKFSDPFLRSLLQATGDADLVEGNTWGDIFWGVCGGVGLNTLGRLLMGIREKGRAGDDAPPVL